MPFDAFHVPPQTLPRLRRAPSRDVTLGVFSDGVQWKVYQEFDRPSPYPSWSEAMAAGYALARAALKAGAGVQMFAQDEHGGFSQVTVERD